MGAVTSAIGVDIGTTNTKVVLVGDRDTLLAAEPTPTTLDALITLVGRALSRADVPVAAVGIAAMAESGFVLDADGHARTPLLVMHGEADTFVPPYMARRIYDACSTKKRLDYFPGAGHCQSCLSDPKRYFSEVFDFLGKLV